MIYTDPVFGVDVSMHQPNFPWPDARKICDFAWIKTSEGVGYVDPWWLRHSTQANGTGILWGGYHFARANGPDWRSDALAEADFFFDAGGMDGPIPGALDMEHTSLDRDATIAWAKIWCQRVAERCRGRFGRIPVYWGGYFTGSPAAMNDPRMAHCWWWMPAYQNGQPRNPNPIGAHVGWSALKGTNGPRVPECWQYTDNGKIPGWLAGVDLNIAPRTSILELAQLVAPSQPVTEDAVKSLIWPHPDSAWTRDQAHLPAPAGELRHAFVQEGLSIKYLGTANPHTVADPGAPGHNPVIGKQQFFARAAGREFVNFDEDLLYGYELPPARPRAVHLPGLTGDAQYDVSNGQRQFLSGALGSAYIKAGVTDGTVILEGDEAAAIMGLPETTRADVDEAAIAADLIEFLQDKGLTVDVEVRERLASAGRALAGV